MKLIYANKIGWTILVILLMLLPSKVAISQKIPDNNKITILNQQLQQAIDSGNAAQALKITNILIQELNNYRSDLQETLDSTTADDSQIKNPKSPNPPTRFGRELVLEESLSYRDNRYVCVVGKIRNNSRSQIVNPVYVIADFMRKDNSYLGSRATRLNLNPIAANETVSFRVFSPPNNSDIERVKLRFQGINQERKISLYPTTNSATTLFIDKGNCQRIK